MFNLNEHCFNKAKFHQYAILDLIERNGIIIFIANFS